MADLLASAQRQRLIGPGPLQPHIDHAERLAAVLPAEGLVVDLGSGGGLPGLPLLVARPDLRWVLVDASARRVAWLASAIDALGASDRAEARHDRAETLGRGVLRECVDAVVARAFARPPVTAECAAPLLRLGGWLWVAEPPSPEADRWPIRGLASLGLGSVDGRVHGWTGLRKDAPCPDRYPRRPGIPEKRPLF